MDIAESLIDYVFAQTGWIATILAIATFLFLGWLRLPSPLALGMAASGSFAYIVSITRETGIDDAGDLLLLRALGTATYCIYLAVAHWFGRTVLGPGLQRFAKSQRW